MEIAPLQRGFDLPNASIKLGKYPVVMSNGIGGYHSEYKVHGPGVVTGRSGTIGKLHYIESDFWPHNTTLWVTDFKGNNQKFIYYLYQKLDLKRFGTGSGVPTLNRNDVHDTIISVPVYQEQEKISSYLKMLDDLITFHHRKSNLFNKTCRNAWEQRKFSELYVKVSEKNDLSFGSDKIISVANMYFKEDIKESSDRYMKTYNVMRLGDIAFEGNKSKNYAHGRFVENTIGDGIVSHVFDVFRPIVDYDLNYWKYFINNEGVMGRTMARCTKSSTMMTNLVSNDFLKETVLVPTLAEQRRIGECLHQLGNLITLHQRKCNQLQIIRKYMLKNMFL